jgi:hypothetical protein
MLPLFTLTTGKGLTLTVATAVFEDIQPSGVAPKTENVEVFNGLTTPVPVEYV